MGCAMQDKTGSKNRLNRRVKQKHVGDETPNPLPDDSKTPSDRDPDDQERRST